MKLKNIFENTMESILVGTIGLGMLAGASYLINGVILRDYHLNELLRKTDTNQNYVLEETELRELYRKANIPFDLQNSNPRNDLSIWNIVVLPLKYSGGRK